MKSWLLRDIFIKSREREPNVKTDEGSNNLFAITSCTEDVIRLGMTPSKKTVVSELVRANVKGRKHLKLQLMTMCI